MILVTRLSNFSLNEFSAKILLGNFSSGSPNDKLSVFTEIFNQTLNGKN